MKKQLREQLSLQEQKDLLRLIINGEVQTTLDIVNSLPTDLETRSKEKLVVMFERALPSKSYVEIAETPEQVVERLESRMNEILYRNKLNNVTINHMQIEQNRLQAELSEYLANGGTDAEHLAAAKEEIENIEKVIRQLHDDCDSILIEYPELSSIKNKMAEILSEK
jgi:hypothetical protein